MLALEFISRSNTPTLRSRSARALFFLVGVIVFVLAAKWESPADPAKLGLDLESQRKPTEAHVSHKAKADTGTPVGDAPSPVGGKIEEDFMLQAGDRIFFAPQSVELSLREREILSAQARWLKGHEKFSALLQGYSDDPPLTDVAQDQLAQKRAEEVFKFLVREGVRADRLSVVSMGRKHPIALCEDAPCAAQNRRVVTVLTTKKNPSSIPSRDPAKKGLP